jgi:uncharacterized damage-inducible protein DinB
MSAHNEVDTFRTVWDMEAKNTLKIMESLPADQYDFRPYPKGRSIGEMAWHLSEIDAFFSLGIEKRDFAWGEKPPNLERPREIKLLAPGYKRIHEEAVARLRDLKPEHLDESITFFEGSPMAFRDVLWGAMLHHLIHHRAQLVLMCRMAGGTPPGL